MSDGFPLPLWQELLRFAAGATERPPAIGDWPDAAASLRAYLDFLTPAADDGMTVLAHLGTSLDGRIATQSGHAAFVTGPANLTHMHRLRALANAVLVGAGTVAADDPQLTVRLVPGRNPLRVVLDPTARLTADRRLFRPDPLAATLLIRSGAAPAASLGAARLLRLDRPEPAAVLHALHAEGVRRLFIEGGGVTVSRFLAAGCLDELQLCTAPVIIGSGRPALTLAPIARMDEALRPPALSLVQGEDRLWRLRLQRRASA